MVSSCCSNEADLAEQRLLGRVQVADEVDDAVLVLERLRHLAVGSLVDEADLEALVEECHDLEALHHRLGPELDLFEDGGVGPEGDRRAGPPPRCLPGDLELADGLAAVLELEDVVVAVAVDLQEQSGGEGVDHRDTHTVEATRHLVAAAFAEFAAGVEDGQDHFGRRLAPLPLHRIRSGSPGRRRPPARRRRPGASRRSGCSSRPWPRRRRCRRPPTPGGGDRSGRWNRCTSRVVCGPGPDPPGR